MERAGLVGVGAAAADLDLFRDVVVAKGCSLVKVGVAPVVHRFKEEIFVFVLVMPRRPPVPICRAVVVLKLKDGGSTCPYECAQVLVELRLSPNALSCWSRI